MKLKRYLKNIKNILTGKYKEPFCYSRGDNFDMGERVWKTYNYQGVEFMEVLSHDFKEENVIIKDMYLVNRKKGLISKINEIAPEYFPITKEIIRKGSSDEWDTQNKFLSEVGCWNENEKTKKIK